MLASTLAELYARAPRGIRLGLETMQQACERAGHPEAAFASVHIAGTNGKGSTAAMVEAMARAEGLRTGLYTSPHLCRFAERIRIDGEPLTDGALDRFLRQALALAPSASFFEVATLAAFLAFRDARVDLGVVEVGLGGRLDATNVLPTPKAAAVTSIGWDHKDWLGDTLEAIACEKSGIAKRGVPVVLGAMPAPILEIVQRECLRREANPVVAEHQPSTVQRVDSSPRALVGDYQRSNALVATHLGQLLGLSEEALRRGLASAHWPGRLETLRMPHGSCLLDAAHNEQGALALASHLQTLKLPPARVALVFGALADKDWHPMLDALAPFAEARFYAPPKGRAPTAPDLLATRHPGACFEDGPAACRHASAWAREREGLVVVAGSIYLLGEVRAHLLELPTDPPVAL
jgi:dihydrofolate synthase/folylpolyglutamate synthase